MMSRNQGNESGQHMGLAERLRAETRELHTAAERAGIMPALLRGQLDRGAYCALLRNLHPIYASLEAALAGHATHAVVGPVVFPALFKRDALADDLRELHGDRWATDLPLLPAAAAYAQRLRDIDAASPELLVAHGYVRSLGDLSGGQLLRGIVARSLGLGDARGTSFYAFGPAADVARQLHAFRAALNGLPADPPCVEAIVAEARAAFERHVVLFEQLAALAPVLPGAR